MNWPEKILEIPGSQRDCGKTYKKVGASRKKILTYLSCKPSEAQEEYYQRLFSIEARLASEGVDFDVMVGWKRERLSWATGVTIVAPMEVRNESDLAPVAKLGRRLLLGQTLLQDEFPNYKYGRKEWLEEQTNTNGTVYFRPVDNTNLAEH